MNYSWSLDQDCWVPLSRRAGESEHHWNQRKASAHIRCPSELVWFEHYLPSLYGAYGEPIVIAVIGNTVSGKTTLLTMLGAELERSSALKGQLSFLPLDQGLAEYFQRNYAKPLLEERRPVIGTPEAGFNSFFHAWRGFNHRTGRQFIISFFDVAGGDLIDEQYLPTFISASNAFLFLADSRAVLDDYPADAAVDNILNILGLAHFDGLPTAVAIAKSDLLQERPEVWHWLDRDDATDLSTIEQESEDAYVFLALNAGPGWLRPVRDLPATTLHFLSATGTGNVDPDHLRFDEHNFGPRRVLRPLLSLLKEIGIIDPTQFASHDDCR